MNLNLNRYGKNFDADKFRKTLEEELAEMWEALAAGDTTKFLDGALDSITVLAGGVTQQSYNPELALKQVVKEITSRKQNPEQVSRWAATPSLQDVEKWQKDLNQDPSTLYKADFSTCKLKG